MAWLVLEHLLDQIEEQHVVGGLARHVPLQGATIPVHVVPGRRSLVPVQLAVLEVFCLGLPTKWSADGRSHDWISEGHTLLELNKGHISSTDLNDSSDGHNIFSLHIIALRLVIGLNHIIVN